MGGLPPYGGLYGISVLPCVLGALISVILIRSGFLALFFLIPLGFVAAVYNGRTAWATALAALGINALISFGFSFAGGLIPGEFVLDVFYFALMTAVFVWIIAPPLAGPDFLRMRTAYRLVAAAVAAALLFLGVIYASARSNSGFMAFLRAQAEMLSSLYIAQAGTDAVQQSFLERQLTPERIMEAMGFVALRGGALASCMVIFYISRQLACSLAVLIRHIRPKPGIRDFHTPAPLIWVLSFSLLGVLLARVLKSSILEIAAWNMLIICAMMYLAQGGGIIQYHITRRNLSSFMRLLFNVLIILLILSPGINALALGALILLGVAENWAPLRTPKPNGPPSTPAV
ncbi:hypothetical protein AGMMS49587_18370 [Spirochaetia bacterium]|nr:hypothetical protein AGMMS49587_18370 [Spirochaetia bacterium]